MHKISCGILLMLMLACASVAEAHGCNNRFVAFGDSLTDPGNAYAATGVISTPPFSLIPSAPYASHTFSNGPTWAEWLAFTLGSPESGAPAFVAPGSFTNYAVGGARARAGSGSFDLTAEVSLYLSDYGGQACPTPTYVVWIGGDDLRDALTALATATSPADGQAAALAIIGGAINGIADNVGALYASGARKFLILTAPDVSHAPAVRMLGPAAIAGGAELSAGFNQALSAAVAQLEELPGIHLATYDDNVLTAAIIANPAKFGLRDVTDPCLQFGVVQNAVCARPWQYLFWDGIHPTAAGHVIVAGAVLKNEFAPRSGDEAH
ncbi:MAG TPA: SGNH/GDSL hydrolase family protein [Steroidobacteraceae bacterium]|nr:SGNH/GDSL hydrolase family protein [Steroidobacteraceae bacterium]